MAGNLLATCGSVVTACGPRPSRTNTSSFHRQPVCRGEPRLKRSRARWAANSPKGTTMKKESPPAKSATSAKSAKGNAPEKAADRTADKAPPKVPDADIEYEDTTHDDDQVQQSSRSDTSVPPDTK